MPRSTSIADDETIYSSRGARRVANREARTHALERNPMQRTEYHAFGASGGDRNTEDDGGASEVVHMPRARGSNSILSDALSHAEEANTSLGHEEENAMWKRNYMDRHRRRMARMEEDEVPVTATRLAAAPHRRRVAQRMRTMYQRGEDEVQASMATTTTFGGDEEEYAYGKSKRTRHIAEESDAIDSRPRVRRQRHRNLPAHRTQEDPELSHREDMRRRSREVQAKSRRMGSTRLGAQFTRAGSTNGFTQRNAAMPIMSEMERASGDVRRDMRRTVIRD